MRECTLVASLLATPPFAPPPFAPLPLELLRRLCAPLREVAKSVPSDEAVAAGLRSLYKALIGAGPPVTRRWPKWFRLAALLEARTDD